MREVKEVMICKIGKKEDKSNCAKKDCENCRHYKSHIKFEN